ncbi:MAG: alkaline phosphatase family protein [bacterium]|nr:alkaline phosphatase family protein [bacterium]
MRGDPGRLFIMGWDGADWHYLSWLVKSGKLPFLAAVFKDGRAAPLLSTVPPISPAAWVSFSTGKTPGEHGVFSFYRRPPESSSYRRHPISSDYWSEFSIWEALDRQSIPLVLHNVPMTYPPLKLTNGVCISGLGSPGEDVSCLTSPDWVGAELKHEVPGYVADLSTIQGSFTRDNLVADVMKMAESRIRAVRWLFDRVAWSIFFMVFTAPDRLEHEFWKFHDPTHPGHKDHGWERYCTCVPALYRKLDAFLGEILARLDKKDTLLVISDHGFGPLEKEFYVNRWLEETGLLIIKPDSPLARGKSGPDSLVESVDWTRTQIYCMGHLGELFLNLKGREPAGIIDPGDEAESVLRQVERRLKELVDPVDGKPLCDWVRRGADLFHGERSFEAPDLLFCMQGYRIKGYMTGRGFEFQDRSRPLISSVVPGGRSGEHREEGIALASGNLADELVPGRQRISDLGCRIARLFGVDTNNNTARQAKKNTPVKAKRNVYTTEEEEILRERLRSLGYLE